MNRAAILVVALVAVVAQARLTSVQGGECGGYCDTGFWCPFGCDTWIIDCCNDCESCDAGFKRVGCSGDSEGSCAECTCTAESPCFHDGACFETYPDGTCQTGTLDCRPDSVVMAVMEEAVLDSKTPVLRISDVSDEECSGYCESSFFCPWGCDTPLFDCCSDCDACDAGFVRVGCGGDNQGTCEACPCDVDTPCEHDGACFEAYPDGTCQTGTLDCRGGN